ncbi:MAG: glycosyltransferase [Lentisphaerae bacterium]|nr:glycosyltransferase [Lentisphaerota bacterium]
MQEFIILIPVYNDWESVRLLMPDLDRVLASLPGDKRVILIDDGSTQFPPADLLRQPCAGIQRVDLLSLRRNLGHQRAIAIGFCYVWEHVPCDAVLVMDADGEDAPSDIPRLMACYQNEGAGKLIFAERARRSEGVFFRAFYQLYRGAHWLLTGIEVKVGNFSLVPRTILSRLVVVSDLWNHYSASVFKARLPHAGIATQRAKRLHGQSRMNFVALVVHGLSAISVFSDLAGVRLLICFGGVLTLTLLALGGMIIRQVATGAGLWGWAGLGIGFLLMVLLQVGLFALMACFITLGARNNAGFIPQRDYHHFVDGLRTLFGGEGAAPGGRGQGAGVESQASAPRPAVG